MATYTIGFAESLLDLLADVVPTWDGIVVPISECAVAGCRDNDVRIIAAPCLVLFLVIAFAGMDWVTRIQKALLVGPRPPYQNHNFRTSFLLQFILGSLDSCPN